MKAALSNILKLLGACLALVVGLYAILALINLKDEELTAEARQFIEDPSPPPPTVPQAQNAFYAILGFTAGKDKDMHSKGVALVEAYHQALGQPRPEATAGAPATPPAGADQIRFVGKPDVLCSRAIASCQDHAAASEGAIRALLVDNAVLVARYRRLSAYPAYENPMKITFSTPLPNFSDPIQTANLVLTVAGLLAAQGGVDEAFGMVIDDLAFWRRMQPGRQLLVEKMAKTAQMRADLRVLSELIGRHPLPAAREAQLADVLAPLTERERDLVTVMRTEALMSVSFRDRALLFDAVQQEGGWFASREGFKLAMPFYQPNATFNRYAHAWAFQTEIARVPSTNYLVQLAAYEHRYEEEFAHSQLGPTDWYNPVGKLMFAVSSPGSFARYPARIHDLSGMLSLVALQARIRQLGIPDGMIAEFVAGAGPAFQDPYTGRPMRWDEEKRTLSFFGYGNGTKLPIAVQIPVAVKAETKPRPSEQGSPNPRGSRYRRPPGPTPSPSEPDA